jgi:hypothetical protein
VSRFGKQSGSPSGGSTYDPESLPRDVYIYIYIYLRETKLYVHTESHMEMFTAAFIIHDESHKVETNQMFTI